MFCFNQFSFISVISVMRMTMSTGSTMTSRVHRKVVRIPSKRHPGKAIPGKLHSMNRVSNRNICVFFFKLKRIVTLKIESKRMRYGNFTQYNIVRAKKLIVLKLRQTKVIISNV